MDQSTETFCNSPAYFLVNKFRVDHCDEYRKILKMHLTRTDLNLEVAERADALWPTGNYGQSTAEALESSNLLSKSAKTKLEEKPTFLVSMFDKLTGGKSEGLDESKTFVDSICLQRKLAPVLLQMMTYMENEEQIKTEGIFRKFGSKQRQSNLYNTLSIEGQSLTSIIGGGVVFSVHDIASLFKQFLVELPQPLLSDAHYSAYLEVAGWAENIDDLSKSERVRMINRQLAVVRLLLLIMPDVTYWLSSIIIRFLGKVATYEESNKMSIANLAAIFTPAFFHRRSKRENWTLHKETELLKNLLTLIIERADEIFQVSKELVHDIEKYYSKEKNISQGSSSSSIQTTSCFADRKRSASSGATVNTETEVAGLCAYVQAMPDGREKTTLLKQFRERQRNLNASRCDQQGRGRLGRLVKRLRGVPDDCVDGSPTKRMRLLQSTSKTPANRGEQSAVNGDGIGCPPPKPGGPWSCRDPSRRYRLAQRRHRQFGGAPKSNLGLLAQACVFGFKK